MDESNITKTCYSCGKEENRKLSDRVITCDCGNSTGRILNSAVNIMLRFLSRQSPVNGESLEEKFLGYLHRYTARAC
ncbi:transposase [Candidatus Bathyarchaeota archaeon]|nr:transposase [Candidatus Bathyarchaeota archaeon]